MLKKIRDRIAALTNLLILLLIKIKEAKVVAKNEKEVSSSNLLVCLLACGEQERRGITIVINLLYTVYLLTPFLILHCWSKD